MIWKIFGNFLWWRDSSVIRASSDDAFPRGEGSGRGQPHLYEPAMRG